MTTEPKTFYSTHKTQLLLAGTLSIVSFIVGMVCTNVFSEDSKGKDTHQEGAHSMGSAKEYDDATPSHAMDHFFQNYAKHMNEGDPLAISMTVIIALAVMMIVTKLVSSNVAGSATSATVTHSNSSNSDKINSHVTRNFL